MKRFKFFLSICFAILLSGCSGDEKQASGNSDNSPDYTMKNATITVDGKVDDWDDIKPIQVNGKDHIWVNEDLPLSAWKGDEDLSFEWKGAHRDGKLYFLIRVNDDTLSDFSQEHAWENDCVEIHLDHQNIKGDRIVGIDTSSTLEDRFGKRLRGHEMQFLPSGNTMVFFNDSKNIYYTDSAQTEQFQTEWHGKAVTTKFQGGYFIEIEFAVPNYYALSSQKMGIDLAVCDDDGAGRKSLMVWSAFKGAFWLTMDNFKEIVLE